MRNKIAKDQLFVENALQNEKVKDFVYSNLRESLAYLGFGAELINDLLSNLQNLDIESFWNKHKEELDKIFTIGFLQHIAPEYFKTHVIPEIKKCKKIVDIGCGTGILAKILAETGRFDEIVGIEIIPYPEWKMFTNEKISFEVVQEEKLEEFLVQEQPDSVVLTWVLHHMEYDQQVRYMQRVYDVLKPGAQVIILEDAYSTVLEPLLGKELHDKFMHLTLEERHAITGINDWTANRILGQRAMVPVPFGYRTVEEWKEMFSKIGYKNTYEKYIGFPDRDVYNPQSTIVFEK